MIKRIGLLYVIGALFSLSCSGPADVKLVFSDYPQMKIGFCTRNFMNAKPFTIESINELIHYAGAEGYQFISLRDDEASLSVEQCKTLAENAQLAGIEVIYEIDLSLLHPEFEAVFKKAIENTMEFGNPGILRAAMARSELVDDPGQPGWTMEKLTEAALVAEKCAKFAADQGLTFVVENLTEPFIGNPPYYYGLSDLFEHTRLVGLQFDLCNPFAAISQKKASAGEVADYLESLGDRWISSQIKTSIEGIAQPVLGQNPLPVETLTTLMGKNGIHYFVLDLAAVEDPEEAFKNHEKSIEFLKKLGLITKNKSVKE